MTSLDKFEKVTPRHTTHVSRLIGIIQRHGKYSVQWVDAIKTYPAGSAELDLMLSVLSKDINNLLEELKENLSDLQSDFVDLSEVFSLFQKEIAQIKENKNVSRPTIIRSPRNE